MRCIQKEDILGARIVDIHTISNKLQGDLDCFAVYFTVDRGFTFTMPRAGKPWRIVECPEIACPLQDEYEEQWTTLQKTSSGRFEWVTQPPEIDDRVKRIKQQIIAGAYCLLDEGGTDFELPDEGVIVFEDGSQLSCTTVAPCGTGAAGLHYNSDPDDCWAKDELVDYFTIPLS